jgi:hypothetical protein
MMQGPTSLRQRPNSNCLRLLQDQVAETPTFKLANYPGWRGSILVFPDKAFGSAKLPAETSFAI